MRTGWPLQKKHRMTNDLKVKIELPPAALELLRGSVMIHSVCRECLAPARQRRRGNCIVLTMSPGEADFLLGHVAAETNHCTDRTVQLALNEICERIENALNWACRDPRPCHP